jgi:hypothetical protein
MYAAKREGGQCIRGFVPDQPFPYTFLQYADEEESPALDAITAPAYQGAVATAGKEAAPPRPARKPIAQIATPPREQLYDTPTGIRWPPTSIRTALALLIIGVTAYSSSRVFGTDAGHSAFFTKFLYSALNLSAAALIAVRAYRVMSERLAWILIAAGMTCSAVGDVIYALWVPDGQSPSVADPAYLAFYPFVYAGLLLLMRARRKRVPIALRLDSLVCGFTMAALAAALTAGPIRAAAARAPSTVLVGVLYPWGDLVLLALAAGMLPIFRWRNEFRWGLLIAGLIGFAVADTAYLFQTAAGSYRVGSALDACWPASSLLLAMASWAPSSSVVPIPRRGFGPYIKPVDGRRPWRRHPRSQLATRGDPRRIEPGGDRGPIRGDFPRRQHAGRKPQAGDDRRIDRPAQSALAGDGPDRAVRRIGHADIGDSHLLASGAAVAASLRDPRDQRIGGAPLRR